MAYQSFPDTNGSAGSGASVPSSEEQKTAGELEDVILTLPGDEQKKDYSAADDTKQNEIQEGGGEVAEAGGEEEGDEKGGKKKKKKREVWDNRFQFLLTLVGYAVGLGNVWRFSYLVAKNGGSAFLVPYTIMLFVLGIPLFYLELTFGQATRKGTIMAWFMVAPNLVGIGVSSFIIDCFVCLYYNVIIAWVFYYLFNSFHARLPWGFCFGQYIVDEDIAVYLNRTDGSMLERLSCFNRSTEYFWYTSAAEATDSIGVAARFNWQMFLCLLLAWVVVYLCLFRGIQSSGKVVYFTATFPYVVLICFFFRGVTLPGAGDGISYLFLPSGGKEWFAQAFSPQVWLEAATQIFFSLGLSLGALIALASYTKPRYNTLVDSFIVCLTNSFTSIFASVIVFSIVGFRAHQLGIEPNLVSTGPGLAFIVFTEALLHMPGAPFWAFLFFVMLLLLGLDSQFASMEGIITVVRDIKVFKKIRKELLIAIICVIFFLISFPFVLGNGLYLFGLFDQFAATIPLLLIGFAEYVALAWVYGVNRFFTELAKPISRYMQFTWMIMWKWVGPIVMFVIFFASVILELIDPLKYTVYLNFSEIDEVYPGWAQFIGAVIILMAVLPIPIVLIVRLILYQSARDEAVGFFKSLRTDAEDVFRYISHLRYRRGRWSPQEDDLDNLYENTETPYQWELNDPTSGAPGKDNIDGSAPVVGSRSGNSVDARVKENGGVSS